MQLIPPKSDLVSESIPYVAVLELTEASMKERLHVRLDLHRVLPDGRRQSLECGGSTPLLGTPRQAAAIDNAVKPAYSKQAVLNPPATPSLTLTLDSRLLAPGQYGGQFVVRAGREEQTFPLSFYRIPGPKPADFPYGIYAVPFAATPAEREQTLKELHAAGINLICNHLHKGLEDDSPAYDQAARYGMRFLPSLGPDRSVTPGLESQLNASDPAKQKTTAPCYHRSIFRENSSRRLAEHLAGLQAHPAFSGGIYYGDDLFMAAACASGQALISCYCEDCRRDFRDRFGFDPPLTTPARRGVVPVNDPWLVWMRYRSGETYGGFIRDMERVCNAATPPVALGLCHGAPDNSFVQLTCGLYGPLTQPARIVSSYCYPLMRSPTQDFICHYEIGKMGHREAEVWMLGLYAADATVAPTWQVQQNYWNMLAAGYKLIAYFSWWDHSKIMEGNDDVQKARLRTSYAALARCGRHKDWILPAARHWQDPDTPFAALYSFTTEAFDVAPEHRSHTHSKRVCEFYRHALRRQVPLKIICEEEIRAGILSRFKAVCLPDARALPDDVVVKLWEFAAAGGILLADPDYLYTDGWHPEARPYIKGALNAAPETAVEILRQQMEPTVDVSNPDVTVRRFISGDVDTFVFVNNYADRFWGMDYTYGDPNENYRRAALVRDEAVEANVRFHAQDRWVVDLSSGDVLGPTSVPLLMTLDPSWGRVLALIPSPKAALRVQGPAQAQAGAQAHYAVQLHGEDGRPIRGVFTVRVRIASPSGAESLYSGYLGIDGVAGEFVLPLGINDEPGLWHLTFEGGFPRATVTRELEVRASTGSPASLLAGC